MKARTSLRLKLTERGAGRVQHNCGLTFTVFAAFGAVGVRRAGSGAHGHPGDTDKLIKRRVAAASLAATRNHYDDHFFHHSSINIYTIAHSRHQPRSQSKSPNQSPPHHKFANFFTDIQKTYRSSQTPILNHTGGNKMTAIRTTMATEVMLQP